MDRWFQFIHLFSAFGFVGALVVADWNGRAARRSQDWAQRATCFEIIASSLRLMGFPSLVLLGVFGNLLLTSRGYRMEIDTWPRWVNALWLVQVLLVGALSLPAAGRLARLARAAATGSAAPADWDGTLMRWRLGNFGASILYLALLALMVFRWRG